MYIIYGLDRSIGSFSFLFTEEKADNYKLSQNNVVNSKADMY